MGNTALDNATKVVLLGVEYLHVRTPQGGDLYLTEYGQPFAEHLLPENWYQRPWFERNREKLSGTSTVYKVRTRPVRGAGKDLVVKWSRVGEEVPFDTFTFTKFVEAQFNSPYEEFALVMELRKSPGSRRIRTHKPLAIYVPEQRLPLWQTGRLPSRMELKKAKFRDVELDIFRQYILVYEWVKGVSCNELLAQLVSNEEQRQQQIIQLTEKAISELAEHGFRVLDMKPDHVIVRPDGHGGLLRDSSGEVAYALVDFELLERTPEHEREVSAQRRAIYLQHQRDRFQDMPVSLPQHLHCVEILGVTYIFGPSESTQGALWVVGKDPTLFDYFLPERWRRTRRTRMSENNETYYTKSKDQIHLVWKVSRCGEPPEVAGPEALRAAVREYGFNSPFEEFAMALDLQRKGFPTTYPRAIYMTGRELSLGDYHADPRRYKTHEHLRMPDGHPILRPDHNYIMIWGYWNGLDEVLARKDEAYCRGINLEQARRDGLISADDVERLLQQADARLRKCGYEDLGLKPTHFLLSLSNDGRLLRDSDGTYSIRMCNFSLVRPLG